jgi:hypothetical protein
VGRRRLGGLAIDAAAPRRRLNLVEAGALPIGAENKRSAVLALPDDFPVGIELKLNSELLASDRGHEYDPGPGNVGVLSELPESLRHGFEAVV